MTDGLGIIKFGDVCDFVRGPFGGSLKKSCFVEKGFAVYEQQHAIYNQFTEIRYFIDEDKFNEMKRFELKPNDLIMSCSGTMGKVAIVPQNLKRGIINQALLKLSPKNNLNVEYLRYWMTSPDFDSRIRTNSVGAAIKNVASVKILKQIEVPVPSVEKQKEIVGILDQAFESIEKAKANIEKNIENAKELFQSKANQIFSQAGEGWEETNIGEIGKVSMCKRILKHQTSQTGEIPFYKIGTFGKEPNAYINAETFNLFKEKYSYPKIGDILLSASGTIGRRVIFDGKPAYFQDSNIVWIDNNEEIILNKYLYHFYEFCDWNPSKGATIKRLYNDDLRRIKISYPTCLEKQKEIIEVIEILDNHIQSLLSLYEEELKNLEELKKSILQKAFSGELTNKNKAA